MHTFHTASSSHDPVGWHGTTILCVRRGAEVAMAGDGQVTLGSTVVKGNARKVRRIGPQDNILAGFAGLRQMPLPCLSGWKPSWNATLTSLSAPVWNWQRIGGQTVICAGWKP